MNISVFDLFTIGIGPSSSHTIGPMRAAHRFAELCLKKPKLKSLSVELFGSLAFTGKGHGTDKAILLGLSGDSSETIHPRQFIRRAQLIKKNKKIKLLKKRLLLFDPAKCIIFNYKDILSKHPNAMRFTAYNSKNKKILQKTYYSIGGGFLLRDRQKSKKKRGKKMPYPFKSAKELLKHCKKHRKSIAKIMFANERTWRTKAEIEKQLLRIASVMSQSIQQGRQRKGILPGGLKMKRRAHQLFKKLNEYYCHPACGSLEAMNWVSMYALAVAEENASFGRVVTAPTNGSAGILPAVFEYYKNFCREGLLDKKIINFLLTAGAIGILFKQGASISGAEVGCQGEVGVACSMAAGALVSILGGTLAQIEQAAEMAMEHHLGLTCDPVAGLVQIPCIERNAIAATQAVNIAYLVLMESGKHKVSLDETIATMKQTGHDMMSKYKETAQGGLAVNISTC